MDEKKIVDFKHEETEAGWIQLNDNFFRKNVPIYFNWLSWILILGVFQYLFEAAQVMKIKVLIGFILGVSQVSLLLYFNSIFFRIEFRGFPFIKSRGITSLISLILSGVLVGASWIIAMTLVAIVKTKA